MSTLFISDGVAATFLREEYGSQEQYLLGQAINDYDILVSTWYVSYMSGPYL